MTIARFAMPLALLLLTACASTAEVASPQQRVRQLEDQLMTTMVVNVSGDAAGAPAAAAPAK